MAWQVNHRAAKGDATDTRPSGTARRAAWIGSSVVNAPLARGKAVVSQRCGTRTNTAAGRAMARSANHQLTACELHTHAAGLTHFGGSMVVVTAPSTDARACVAGASR